MTRLTYMVFIVCIILVIAAVGTIVGITVGLEQAYTAGLTAALVLVTAFYAYLNSEILKTSKQSVEVANKQAEAKRIMAEETRESRADSLRPIIVLGRQPIQSGDSRIVPVTEVTDKIYLDNVGAEPALNVVFFRYEPSRENPSGSFIGSQRFIAIAPGDKSEIYINSLFGQARMSNQDLVVQYEDVFGRKWRSGLELNCTQGEGKFTVKSLFYEKID